MTSLEFEGKNVDNAVEKASEELNISKDQLDYKIISYGSSGIFGLAGSKKARIRVNVGEELTESALPADHFDKMPDISSEAVVETGNDAAIFKKESTEDEPAGDRKPPSFPDNPVELGRSVLQRIVDSITIDAKITVDEDSDRVLFNVVGGNAGILIGKRGQTLEAIQSLVEKVVNKHHENKIRVVVDIEGYLEARRANLEKMAIRLAEKSKRIGKPISLGQMSAYERRIIHLALKDHPDVRTQSRGEGYLRKLVIFPKKNNGKKHNIR
jgi:spoIIIJ-associated protein